MMNYLKFQSSILDILSGLWRQKLQIRLQNEEAETSSDDDDDAVFVLKATSSETPAGSSSRNFEIR